RPFLVGDKPLPGLYPFDPVGPVAWVSGHNPAADSVIHYGIECGQSSLNRRGLHLDALLPDPAVHVRYGDDVQSLLSEGGIEGKDNMPFSDSIAPQDRLLPI